MNAILKLLWIVLMILIIWIIIIGLYIMGKFMIWTGMLVPTKHIEISSKWWTEIY